MCLSLKDQPNDTIKGVMRQEELLSELKAKRCNYLSRTLLCG